MAPNAPRPFTTSARVHPALPTFDPHTIAKMQSSAPASRARLGKFFLPVTGILFVGVAASSYLDRRYSATRSSGLSAAEARALHQREQNAALMSAYGDRSSVEDLQRAMELYEVQ
ncbi:hypothetical protein GTA08_BOTSDO00389 [Neofusicoccum parvum]|uniref:Uncharacterized protein n=3 Tax=Neofusicoccum TaxID=407951 RepID=R1GK72_BOTPV|nr:hypothetical protein UCRNP2_6878 [Neofusicoccum parvum UCRNP2]GME36423.1 hypothetical protein GTA08_BOTSDO00389 [Neofusicoccum parvum]GME61451.1 hypothetical protein GTA08_BOTSDO00389 [Neofusicoccum parvum]